ncbi:unnamed protein product [Closterium sp. Naga37s-1]|nr:unnamed protein product [Closterium sp. Naga37s-1]
MPPQDRTARRCPPVLPPQAAHLVHGWVGRAVHGWVGRAVHGWVGRAVHGWVGHAVHGWVGRAVHGWVGRAVHGWVGRAVHGWVGRAVHGWVGRAAHGWVGRAAHGCIGHAAHGYVGAVDGFNLTRNGRAFVFNLTYVAHMGSMHEVLPAWMFNTSLLGGAVLSRQDTPFQLVAYSSFLHDLPSMNSPLDYRRVACMHLLPSMRQHMQDARRVTVFGPWAAREYRKPFFLLFKSDNVRGMAFEKEASRWVALQEEFSRWVALQEEDSWWVML